MSSKTKNKILVAILLFQIIGLGSSELQQPNENHVKQVNEQDTSAPDSSVIPLPLQDILTEEVASYDAPLEFQTNYVYYISGFDHDNQPVWILEVGKWDMRRIIEGDKEKLEKFDRFVHQALYRMFNSTQIRSTTEKPVSKAVLILDFDNFDLSQLSSTATVSYLLKSFRKFLPAFVKLDVAYCINTNFVAHGMINLVRPIMGSEFSKVEVFGTNQAKWMPRILAKIPEDQLPPWYGGAKDFKPYQVYG